MARVRVKHGVYIQQVSNLLNLIRKCYRNWAKHHCVGLVSSILGLYLILSTSNVFAERSDVEKFVTTLYQQCLGRDPDPEGLNYHVNRLMSGEVHGADTAGQLLSSPEFTNRILTNENFVTTLYRCLYSREPEKNYNSYVKKLYDGVSRNEIFYKFVNTPEFKNYCDSHGVSAFSPALSIFSDRFFAILSIVALILVSFLIYLFSKMDERDFSKKHPQ